jgi:hypothetical protein
MYNATLIAEVARDRTLDDADTADADGGPSLPRALDHSGYALCPVFETA